jgi:tetratricopeptide (TPR) repeat protein
MKNITITMIWMLVLLAACGPGPAGEDKSLSYYTRAHDLMLQNQPQKAIPLYEKATKARVGYAQAYHELAVCYQQVGNDLKAIENYQGAIVYNPRDVDAYQSIGNIYFMQNDYNEALTWYERGAEVDYLYPRTYNNIATIYYMRGDHPNAIKYYGQAIAVDPTYPRAYYGLGLIAFIQGDTVEAESKFLDAVRVGSMPEAIYMLGNLYYEKGDLANAGAWLGRYLEKEPAGQWAEKVRDTLLIIEQKKQGK